MIFNSFSLTITRLLSTIQLRHKTSYYTNIYKSTHFTFTCFSAVVILFVADISVSCSVQLPSVFLHSDSLWLTSVGLNQSECVSSDILIEREDYGSYSELILSPFKSIKSAITHNSHTGFRLNVLWPILQCVIWMMTILVIQYKFIHPLIPWHNQTSREINSLKLHSKQLLPDLLFSPPQTLQADHWPTKYRGHKFRRGCRMQSISFQNTQQTYTLN